MTAPSPQELETARTLLTKLIQGANSVKASDIHLRADAPPFVRIDGTLNRTTAPPTTTTDIEHVILVTCDRPNLELPVNEWDYSFEHSSGLRIRCHVFRENGRRAVTMRLISAAIPSFQELRLPPVVKTLCDLSPGLVLITGPTGTGKSTTAASLLRFAASEKSAHVVTIEDPIEYRISETNSYVSQREVGRDTESFATGLHATLREDPDVLFIGEVRDRYALDIAMQAAETGHAVFTTFHTASAQQTLLRLIAMFPQEEQGAARERLADCLRGIVCQRLLKRKKMRGRVLTTEVLVNNYSVRECIRDPSRVKGLTQLLERSKDQGMHSMDQDLVSLAREGLIEVETALAFATSQTDVRRALSGIGT